jgi:hypothetical protein
VQRPPRSLRFALTFLALALALTPGTIGAQARPTVDVALPAPAQLMQAGPIVRARDMLAGSRMRELLAAGFPARFHFKVELWSQGRWFNDVERRTEYDVLARYIAVENFYEVVQIVNDRPFSLGKFAKIEDAEAAIARPTRVPIAGVTTDKKQYYQVSLLVEVLSVSDIDEVDRWLRGELEPAINGRRNPGTAMTRGFRTLAARLLGGEKREYETRTPSFRAP